MATPIPIPRDRLLTVEEYLAFEDGTQERHEYVNGYVYAMVGVTRRHSRIAGNIYGRLWPTVRGGSCRVHAEGVKLQVGSIFYYPDVMVACGPEPDDDRIEDAPCLLVEVTSPSTERIDRGEKLMVYRGIAGLGAYLVVDQARRRVDHHWRDADSWRHDVLLGAATIALPCPNLTLSLDEIYEGVAFPTAEQWRRLREEEATYETVG
jgi:Uma2 family endonuclease